MKAKDLQVGDFCNTALKHERNDIENFDTMLLEKTNHVGLYRIVKTGYARRLNGKAINVNDMVCVNPNEDVIKRDKYVVIYGTIAEEVPVSWFFTLKEAIAYCDKNTDGMIPYNGDRPNRNEYFWYAVTLDGKEVYITNEYWK